MSVRRAPWFAAAALVLIAGLWAGLERMGWSLPATSATLIAAHGPLMVCGFLGILISVERAAALGRSLGYAAPALAAFGAIACLVGSLRAAAVLMLLSSAALVVTGTIVFLRTRGGSPFTLAAAAGLWLVGNAIWAGGGTIVDALGFWNGFLVLTIAGGRFRECPPRRLPRAGFAVTSAALVAAVALGRFAGNVAGRAQGVALIALAAWLVAFDTPRRRLGRHGLDRYEALCSLLGYAWLATAGVLALSGGALVPGPGYDVRLHALFLGFVFSMVFGQAPVVFPDMLQARFRFGTRLYVPLVALHLSLILRITGDSTRIVWARQWGGLLGAFSILAFLGTMVSLSGARRDYGAGVA